MTIECLQPVCQHLLNGVRNNWVPLIDIHAALKRPTWFIKTAQMTANQVVNINNNNNTGTKKPIGLYDRGAIVSIRGHSADYKDTIHLAEEGVNSILWEHTCHT